MFFQTLKRDDRRHGRLRPPQKFQSGKPDPFQHVIKQPELGLIEPKPDERNRDEGTDHRRIESGAERVDATDLAIDELREPERNCCADGHHHTGEVQRVGDRPMEPRILEEVSVILQPGHTGRRHQVVVRETVIEGGNDWQNEKYEDEHQRRGDKEVTCETTAVAESENPRPSPWFSGGRHHFLPSRLTVCKSGVSLTNLTAIPVSMTAPVGIRLATLTLPRLEQTVAGAPARAKTASIELVACHSPRFGFCAAAVPSGALLGVLATATDAGAIVNFAGRREQRGPHPESIRRPRSGQESWAWRFGLRRRRKSETRSVVT